MKTDDNHEQKRTILGKKLYLALVVVAVLVVAIFLVRTEQTKAPAVPKVAGCNGTVALNEYALEEATTTATQLKGLGGRDNLPQKCGMLFNFDQVEQHGIWMKDMKFNLDIIWLDQSKRIVSIRENAPYNSYPEVYQPQAASKYVIELNAGQARAGAFRIGQVLTFEPGVPAKVNKH